MPPSRRYGRVDVMLNNAGLMPLSPLDRLKVDEWDRMIDVNIKGVLYGIAAALPHMQRQKSGHIINVSSVAGHKVRAGGAVYAATKHAVRALSEGLRQEVKPYNIRTTVISPGVVATELPNTATEPDVEREPGEDVRRARDSGRLVRAGGRVRDQPAGGRGHQRDPVPPDAAGILSGHDQGAIMEIRRSGSQPSGKGSADWFTGTVRIDPLFQPTSPARAARCQRHLRAGRADGVAHASAGSDADRDVRRRAARSAGAARSRRSGRATSSGSRRGRSTGTAPRRPPP